MWLVPSIHCWEIIQVRPSHGMVLVVHMSHLAETVPRVFVNQYLWKTCVPHPKNEVLLKASGSFSREQLHLCHAKVSGHWQRTETLTSLVWLRLEARQVPPQSAAPGSSLSSSSASLDSSCSQLFPPEGMRKQREQDLISPPHHPGLAWEPTAAAFGPFLLWLTRNLLSSHPQRTCVAVGFPPRTGLSWFHALGSRKSQASSRFQDQNLKRSKTLLLEF